jgi:hypothetical protein
MKIMKLYIKLFFFLNTTTTTIIDTLLTYVDVEEAMVFLAIDMRLNKL